MLSYRLVLMLQGVRLGIFPELGNQLNFVQKNGVKTLKKSVVMSRGGEMFHSIFKFA
jgi:hypothetical protein